MTDLQKPCEKNDEEGQHFHCVGCGCAIGSPELCGECACEDDGL